MMHDPFNSFLNTVNRLRGEYKASGEAFDNNPLRSIVLTLVKLFVVLYIVQKITGWNILGGWVVTIGDFVVDSIFSLLEWMVS